MTPERLKEIEARCAAASEGPWELSKDQYGRASVKDACGWTLADMVTLSPNGPRFRAAQDAALIAHARTDVPALIARVKELEGALVPFADCVFNDNGDMTVGLPSHEDVITAYFVMRGSPPHADELSRLRAENEKLRAFIEPMLSTALGGEDD